jgi:hypothetical protein
MPTKTRSKRTLAEADPNAAMSTAKSTKTTAKSAASKAKTNTKTGTKQKDNSRNQDADKENSGCDHCAGCGKTLANDEGFVTTSDGTAVPVIEEHDKQVRTSATGKAQEKDAGARKILQPKSKKGGAGKETDLSKTKGAATSNKSATNKEQDAEKPTNAANPLSKSVSDPGRLL